MEDTETVATRRSRRSNAGNRMEMALAEYVLQNPDPTDDLEGKDNDFELKDEEDQFFSDFASTDDEAAEEEGGKDSQTGEAAIQDEERAEKKEARTRRERATRAVTERQRVTFDPEAHAAALRRGDDDSPPKSRKTRKRVPTEGTSPNKGNTFGRKSSRKTTVVASQNTKQKLKDDAKRLASQPKRMRPVEKEMSQVEYIALALEMEEGNVAQHRDYLSIEEEKRRRAKPVRPTVQGPLVRWVSRIEHENKQTPEAPEEGETASAATIRHIPHDEVTPAIVSTILSPGPAATGPVTSQYGFEYTGWSAIPSGAPGTVAPLFVVPPAAQSSMPPLQQTPLVSTSYSNQMTEDATTSRGKALSPMQADEVTAASRQAPQLQELVTKNYVVHELGQYEGTRLPNWKQTMQALFGDHVKWEQLKVYTGHDRPYARLIETCPLTGLPAKYRDPRTGVAFADVEAFQTLTKALNHDYVWNETLGCLVEREKPRSGDVDMTTDLDLDLA